MDEETRDALIFVVLLIIILTTGFMLVKYNQKGENVYTDFCKINKGVQSNDMGMRYCVINQTVYRMDYSGDKLIIFKE